LDLWTTVEPYSGYPAETIAWRLVPAFENGGYKVWYNENGSCRGFATWAWMTDEEFETREYSGKEIFARRSGDKFVVVDMIANGGHSDVLYCTRELRKFFRQEFPDVETIWAHRGPRTGWYPNKGG
jgi:hemolysin-activating ACP:hemolysin acyltransferase